MLEYEKAQRFLKFGASHHRKINRHVRKQVKCESIFLSIDARYSLSLFGLQKESNCVRLQCMKKDEKLLTKELVCRIYIVRKKML